MSLPSSQIRSGRWSKGTAIALPPVGMDWPVPCRNSYRALWGLALRPSLAFASGTRLPLWSPLAYESAVWRPVSHLPRHEPKDVPLFDIALLGVTIKPKYVNSADIMADISLTAPGKPRPAAGPRKRRAKVREPVLGPHRAFVLCLSRLRRRSGSGARQARLRARAPSGPAFRQSQSRDEGRGAARRPQDHQAVARPRAQAAHRRGLCRAEGRSATIAGSAFFMSARPAPRWR